MAAAGAPGEARAHALDLGRRQRRKAHAAGDAVGGLIGAPRLGVEGHLQHDIAIADVAVEGGREVIEPYQPGPGAFRLAVHTADDATEQDQIVASPIAARASFLHEREVEIASPSLHTEIHRILQVLLDMDFNTHNFSFQGIKSF